MAEIESSIRDFTEGFEEKIHKGILPPDPARIVKEILEIPAEIEHATPLPPLIEKIHHEVTEPMVEKLPRLPLTADFGEE